MKLILLAVIMIKAGTQLIDNTLSVCPEWQLVKNFVVLFFFDLLDLPLPVPFPSKPERSTALKIIGRSQQKSWSFT